MRQKHPYRADGQVLLCAVGGSLVLERGAWERELSVARAAGWRPVGTLEPDGELSLFSVAWDGSYLLQHGERVAAADALQLGAACRRAMVDAPDDRERFYLLMLADFAEQGEFQIW